VPWPSDTDLRQIVAQNAERLLEAEGIASSGLVRVLAERAQPLLREVFEHVWRPADGRPALFGTELTGALRVRDDDDRLREIAFRADLAQEASAGPCLIDLKTGRPISEAKKVDTRRRDLLRSVARGRSLQALAYACAASGEGRYLYANPERSRGHPVCSVSHDDAELLGVFDEAVRTLLAAWDRGSFLPRLERPEGSDGKSPCDFCQVTEACARGDSGARRRLARWATAEPERSGPGAAALAAARAIFRLPARQSKQDGTALEEPA
jgi:hypothetical protein